MSLQRELPEGWSPKLPTARDRGLKKGLSIDRLDLIEAPIAAPALSGPEVRLAQEGLTAQRGYYSFHDMQRIAGWAGDRANQVLEDLELSKTRAYFTYHDARRVAAVALRDSIENDSVFTVPAEQRQMVGDEVIGRQIDLNDGLHRVVDAPAYLYDRHHEVGDADV
jgi:hypothetical protein